MEALQQIDDWRQAARTTTILYCESDDRLKQNAKDMSEHRKNKKEAKERLLELLKTNNAPGFNIAERGYHVSLANRKSKKAANANLLRARCLEWRGGSGEDLFEFLTAPVVVETHSLQRSAKAKTSRAGKKKKQTAVESDMGEEEEEGDEGDEDEEELEQED